MENQRPLESRSTSLPSTYTDGFRAPPVMWCSRKNTIVALSLAGGVSWLKESSGDRPKARNRIVLFMDTPFSFHPAEKNSPRKFLIFVLFSFRNPGTINHTSYVCGAPMGERFLEGGEDSLLLAPLRNGAGRTRVLLGYLVWCEIAGRM